MAPIKIGSQVVDDDSVINIVSFFILFTGLFIIVAFLLTLFMPDLTTAVSASIATIGNIGPGLAGIGAVENYSWIPLPAKWLLVLSMLLSARPALAAQGLSPQVYQQLTRVHDLMDQSQYASAEKMLNALLAQLGADSYERAVSLQTLAHVQAARDRYPQAAESLKDSLALDVLPEDVQQQARYDLAQLYLASDSPARAVPVLESWPRPSKVNVPARV